MSLLNLRHSVRALLLTEAPDLLLCRHVIPGPLARGVWAPPGGGIEVGESPLAALRRELVEEVGFTVEAEHRY